MVNNKHAHVRLRRLQLACRIHTCAGSSTVVAQLRELMWTAIPRARLEAQCVIIGSQSATCGPQSPGLRVSFVSCSSVLVQATSVGQAVAGFGVSVLSFLTLWAAPSTEHGEVRRPTDVAGAAFAYFGLSAAVVAASVAGYWWLQELPFWHHYTRAADGRPGAHKCLSVILSVTIASRLAAR